MSAPPTQKILPYGRQTIDEDDIAAVVRVLKSDYLTTGPEVAAFERELAEACGAKHAIVVSSGTAALHVAYAAAGLGPGDELLTTPLTFSATANMALAVGASVRLVDVDEGTLCLSPSLLASAIGPRTKIVAPVDFAGNPADMDEICAIAQRHKLITVEDACHSIGGTLHGKPVGSLADLTVFSFHPVKTITTAEGGAVLTNDDQLATRCRDFRSHGLVRDAARLSRNDGPWYYEIQSLGFNYRMPDVLCALGRSQLKKLSGFVTRRREIVARYRSALRGHPRIALQHETPGSEPGWHLFAVQVEGDRRAIFAALDAHGIKAQVHYVAVNDMPLYRALGMKPEDTPTAQRASQRLISLPLYPTLTDEDVDHVVRSLVDALAAQ